MSERVDDLPEEQELRPRRGLFIGVGILFAALALLCLLLGVGGLWYGWLGGALFAIAAVACFLQLSPRFAGLTLRRETFSVQAGLKRETYRWDEVGDFFVDRADAVVFDKLDRQAMSDARRMVGKVRGYDHWIPGVYAMTPAELARHLNRWRERATGVSAD